MLRLLTFAGMLIAAFPAAAQDAPPYPDYPEFRPGSHGTSHSNTFSLALLDKLEIAPAADGAPSHFEGFYRVGTDTRRLWLKARGEGDLADAVGDAEVQALYSKLITPYFEAQAGVRVDTQLGDGDFRVRPQLAVGLEGLAPYFFEVEPAVFVSYKGDVSARFEGSYDVLITQRLVLQPEVEANVALQRVADWGVGSGLNDIEIGARLRYEITRKVAPYVGATWTNRFGDAADFARIEGRSASDAAFIFGLRVWR